MTTFAQVLAIDTALAKVGFHPFTPFWRETIERFYTHPTANTLVARVGRGGAKSFTSTKIGFIETLIGDYRVPPGERHFWAYVSKNKEEAAQRLNLLEAMLRALGFPFSTSGDEISLHNQPRGFRVFACNVGSVSGFRCFGFSADELAKWTAGHNYANPASEVVTSLNAMMVTHPNARRLLISSPLGLLDYHSERFERGNADDQIVASAPTWVANPSISEADTRKQEPDDRVWQREYAAIPANAVNAALDSEEVEAAFAPLAPGYLPPRRGWLGVEDPSSLRGDSYVWARFGVLLPDPQPRVRKLQIGDTREIKSYDVSGKLSIVAEPVTSPMVLRDDAGNPIYEQVPTAPVLRVAGIGSVNGRVVGQIRIDEIVRNIAREFAGAGVRRVFSDQREEASLEALHKRQSINFESLAWTNSSKVAALATLRRLLRERAISIDPTGPNGERMREQLLGLEEKLLPSGAFTYAARRGAHDDFASILLTICMAINEGRVPDSDAWISNGRTIHNLKNNLISLEEQQ